MNINQIQQHRRQRLSEWLTKNGGVKVICAQNGLSKSVETQISQILRGFSFGPHAARNIEALLGIPHFILDVASPLAGMEVSPAPSPSSTLQLTSYLRSLLPEPTSIHLKQFQLNDDQETGPQLQLKSQPGLITDMYISEEWLSKNVENFTDIKNLRVLTGFGDEMWPMFNPGDPLLIDCGVKEVTFNSVYLFRFANESFVRRLQQVPKEGIRVISTNKKYDIWTIKPKMNVEILGRVVKAWSSYDF